MADSGQRRRLYASAAIAAIAGAALLAGLDALLGGVEPDVLPRRLGPLAPAATVLVALAALSLCVRLARR